MPNTWRQAALTSGTSMAPVYDRQSGQWIMAPDQGIDFSSPMSWIESALSDQQRAQLFRDTGTIVSPSAPGWVVSGIMDDEYEELYWDYVALTGREPPRGLSLSQLKDLVNHYRLEAARKEAERRRNQEYRENFSKTVMQDPFLAAAITELGLSPNEVYSNPVLRDQVRELARQMRDDAKKAYEAGENTPQARQYANYKLQKSQGTVYRAGGTIVY